MNGDDLVPNTFKGVENKSLMRTDSSPERFTNNKT
jgi:hypothetical protein